MNQAACTPFKTFPSLPWTSTQKPWCMVNLGRYQCLLGNIGQLLRHLGASMNRKWQYFYIGFSQILIRRIYYDYRFKTQRARSQRALTMWVERLVRDTVQNRKIMREITVPRQLPNLLALMNFNKLVFVAVLMPVLHFSIFFWPVSDLASHQSIEVLCKPGQKKFNMAVVKQAMDTYWNSTLLHSPLLK